MMTEEGVEEEPNFTGSRKPDPLKIIQYSLAWLSLNHSVFSEQDDASVMKTVVGT
jgi:hypothetical protein